MDCRRFIDSGCLGYLITALSSGVEGVRAMSGCGLELFVSHLEGSRFREKTQVIFNLCNRYSMRPNIQARGRIAMYIA